jgi:hypothetical protein
MTMRNRGLQGAKITQSTRWTSGATREPAGVTCPSSHEHSAASRCPAGRCLLSVDKVPRKALRYVRHPRDGLRGWLLRQAMSRSPHRAWRCLLVLELARSVDWRTEHLLDDELADRHSGNQRDSCRAKVLHFEGECSPKSGVNGWRCEVNEKTTPCERASSLNPRGERRLSGP